MIKCFVVVAVLLFCTTYIHTQQKLVGFSDDEKNLVNSETQRYEKLFSPRSISSFASEWFDVTYYKLNLSISTNPQFLKGCVTIKGVCRQNSDTVLTLDLKNTMHIDSLKVNSLNRSFLHDTSFFNISLGVIYHPGDQLTIDVFYGGSPSATGFGSFVFSDHNTVPWIWSLSEPYGAKDWFPCRDHPSDKADSADIIITCDSLFKVGSNGRLISVMNNGDGTKTHYWQERYPIAPYLISVAITNYEQFSNWFLYTSTDSMEILNYVLPEHFSSALTELPRAVVMLKIFSDLFGLYPFIKEKYGHADFRWGGAMEHQTMTSTTTYSEYTIAHELAHQWFGDMITCRTWPDIWLNEGFAQYSTALYLEKMYGRNAYWTYMRDQLSNARLAEGSLYVRDTSVVRKLFDGALVYSKGATVLHMLRHVLGDSIFFLSIYNYANDTTLKYKTASTHDFQRICELKSGKNLGYFFDEWVYGEKFPYYSFKWNQYRSGKGYSITISIDQVAETWSSIFFTMPLDIRLAADGWDTTVTVLNDTQHQTFSVTASRLVKTVELDPESWILKNVIEGLPKTFSLQQNYPNPFNSNTQIEYQIPKRTKVKLIIYNILGQQIKTLIDEVKVMGTYTAVWYATDVPSGIYFCRLMTPDGSITKKMLLLK